MIEYRPSCGAGSCISCDAALELDAVKSDGFWYCSPTCAQGLPAELDPPPAVREPALYHRPRRFYRKRAPKELKRSASR